MFTITFKDKTITWNNGKLNGTAEDIFEITNITNYLEDFTDGLMITPTGPTIEKDLLKNDNAAFKLITNHFLQRYKDYELSGDIPELEHEEGVIY
jgi:hypothetical protein